MVPYKEKQTVVVSPDIAIIDFHFGAIPAKLKKIIGTIERRDYVQVMKCNTYLVSFPNVKMKYWFKECEILP